MNEENTPGFEGRDMTSDYKSSGKVVKSTGQWRYKRPSVGNLNWVVAG